MKNARYTYTFILLLTVIATLVTSTLRTFALLIEFDTAASYYTHDASLPAVFMWGTLITVVAIIIFIVLMRRDIGKVTVNSDSAAIIYIAAVLGFVIVACTLLDFFLGGSGQSTISTVTLILSIPAALYCIIGVAMPIGNKSAETLLSVLMILWLFFMLIGVYFETGVEINNPNKTLALASMASALLFFVSEGRFLVGTQRRWLYLSSGLITVVVSGLYSLPNAILLTLHAYPDTISVTQEVLCLCLFAYALMRMCICTGMIGEEESSDNNFDDIEVAYGDTNAQ